MKYFYGMIFALLFCFIGHVHAQTPDLQQTIDSAKDVVIIHEGEYKANITISRPIKIIAEGNVLIKPANPNEPILTIANTKQVSIDGLNLDTSKNAIQIKEAQAVQLTNITIQNVHSGIEIYNSKNIEIKNTSVTGNNKHYGNKGNGISIYNSNDILVEENNMNKVQDGVYIENVNDIKVRKNRVENSRYGTHLMYSKNFVAEENVYQKNVTGLMVMMTENGKILKNEVSYQDGFNGTGVTLYDVNGVEIDENNVAGNRVAISIQKTSGVRLVSNKFQMNQTAIESIKSDKSNNATENYFVGNLVNVRSDSIGITLEKNYYDDYSGIDMDGDGIGDEFYVALQSFGQWMVRKPVYQYYVEAPSVVLLNEIDKVTNKSEQQLLVDKKPLTESHKNDRKAISINYWQLTIGLMLLIGCVIVWKRSAFR